MTSLRLLDERFEIGPVLGEGGMGRVFKGRDRLTGGAVAIKTLKPELVARQPQLVERFEREGEALRLLDHPNIVKVIAIPKVDGALHIVMELVDGGSLAALLSAQPKLSVDRVLAIALELADALTRAHHLKIVHRDLKPANVLLTRAQTPRLTDFGIARLGDSTFTATGSVVGTYGYMSPEVLDGRPAGPQADIWSFGIVLYEMLAGRRPFAAEQPGVELRAIATLPPPRLEESRADIPPPLAALVDRMLEKSPEARISSMRLVGAELESIQAQLGGDRACSEVPTDARDPSPSEDAGSSGLPLPPTPFVGREGDIETLGNRLDKPESRLLTVLGAGGMGKTRLAIEVARKQSASYPDGVFFVPLTSVTGHELVVTAIGEASGYRFSGPESSKGQLLNYLRSKRLLLTLDNFDHLLETAPLLSEIVEHAPGVKLLVTSRERLNLRCEEVYNIEGFEIPLDTSADARRSSDAVELFLQSARGWRGGSNIDDDELDAIVEICRLVFGMPLAIELAAGWLEALSPREILAEIRRSVDFLESDLRDLPERHRSLNAVFESSWTRLDAHGRQSMAALSVFRGSFDRGTVQAVTGTSLRTMTHLVNKSLLKRDPSGRYEQHELLRQHVVAKASPTQLAAARDAHARHYAAHVQRQEKRCRGSEQVEALREMEREIHNIRAAWDWALESSGWPILSELLEGIYRFHDMKGLFQLGEALFRRAAEDASLKARGTDGEVLRAKLLSRQGRFVFQVGEFARAREVLEASLSVLRAAHSQGDVAYCLHNLADVAAAVGDLETSEELAREGLHISEQLGDCVGMGTALNNLGVVFYHRKEFDEAERLFRESLDLSRASEDLWSIGFALNNLGVLAHDLRHFDHAEECYRESLDLCEEIGDAHGVAAALVNLGRVRSEVGDLESARRFCSRGLERAQALGEPWTTAACLVNLGDIARAAGHSLGPKPGGR
jgi:predicted ATPase/Tfp pilus assembly protein PilF